MIKLYFGSIASSLSTLLFVVFCIFFGLVMVRRTNITHWGILVPLVFILGLFMSFMSGMKDGTGTPTPVIPVNHWGMTVLCILGGIAFLAAIVALFVRRQDFWQVSFYILSAVIIVKTVITEALRIADAFRH